MGINVKKENLGKEMSGLLIIDRGVPTIGCNVNHSPERQRFTIAHEIGHYVLHRRVKDLFLDESNNIAVFRRANNYSEEDYRYEVEANAFAAALLMPKNKVINALVKSNLRLDMAGSEDNPKLNQMAKDFVVSKQAMLIRINNVLSSTWH